jgi:hypothetical protein
MLSSCVFEFVDRCVIHCGRLKKKQTFAAPPAQMSERLSATFHRGRFGAHVRRGAEDETVNRHGARRQRRRVGSGHRSQLDADGASALLAVYAVAASSRVRRQVQDPPRPAREGGRGGSRQRCIALLRRRQRRHRDDQGDRSRCGKSRRTVRQPVSGSIEFMVLAGLVVLIFYPDPSTDWEFWLGSGIVLYGVIMGLYGTLFVRRLFRQANLESDVAR